MESWIWTFIITWLIVGNILIFLIGSGYSLSSNVIFDMLNPVFIYSQHRVNAFGAIMLALFYNLLSPVVSVCYWFYKLCTVGRK